MSEPVHQLKLASVVLQYPDEERRAAAAVAAELELVPSSAGIHRLRDFCRWYADEPLELLQRRYVEDFDFTKRCSLHLTYHTHGDRRQRGVALLRLKEAFRAGGFQPPEAELPDYLPLLLEFAAIAPEDLGRSLLEEHRVSLELIRGGLNETRSPFEPVLGVITGGLGRLGSRALGRIRRLAADGPPVEEVGLEPFAPPEVMPTGEEATAMPLVGRYEVDR